MSANRHVQVGLLEMQVLWLLGKAPSHGYALMAELSRIKASPITQGTLYPVLASLSRKKLVKASRAGARGKKEYVLTPAGEKLKEETCAEFVRAYGGLIYDHCCSGCPGEKDSVAKPYSPSHAAVPIALLRK